MNNRVEPLDTLTEVQRGLSDHDFIELITRRLRTRLAVLPMFLGILILFMNTVAVFQFGAFVLNGSAFTLLIFSFGIGLFLIAYSALMAFVENNTQSGLRVREERKARENARQVVDNARRAIDEARLEVLKGDER